MKKIVVGISGASGMPLALHLIKVLSLEKNVEVHLVITDGAKKALLEECNMHDEQISRYANITYDIKNIGASIASGTFDVEGMIVIPCTMKTLAGIAHGYSDNLLLRACDVMIKEKRKLILVARETPLSPIHLDNMAYLSRLPQVSILPPVLSYYHHPQTIDEMERHLIGKMLAPFEIEVDGFQRWQNG